MTESRLQASIIRALRDAGCYVANVVVAGEAGVADLLVCAPGGRFLALEVKMEKGRVSKMQEHHMERVRAAGGEAHVVRSVAEALDAARGPDEAR